MSNKINTINYWSTESAVAIVIIQIKKLRTLSKKQDNRKMILFNKKCCKYFCDSISIGFTEEILDLVFYASHTLWSIILQSPCMKCTLWYSPRLDVDLMAKWTFFSICLKSIKLYFSYRKISKEFKSEVKNTFLWPFHPPYGDLKTSHIFRKFKFQNKTVFFFLPKKCSYFKSKIRIWIFSINWITTNPSN